MSKVTFKGVVPAQPGFFAVSFYALEDPKSVGGTDAHPIIGGDIYKNPVIGWFVDLYEDEEGEYHGAVSDDIFVKAIGVDEINENDCILCPTGEVVSRGMRIWDTLQSWSQYQMKKHNEYKKAEDNL